MADVQDDGGSLHAGSILLLAVVMTLGLFQEATDGAGRAEVVPAATGLALGLASSVRTWLDDREPPWLSVRVDAVLGFVLASVAAAAAAAYLSLGWSSTAVWVHLLIAAVASHTSLRSGGHWLRDVLELATIGLVLGALYVLATGGPEPVWLLVAVGALGVLGLEQFDRPGETA